MKDYHKVLIIVAILLLLILNFKYNDNQTIGVFESSSLNHNSNESSSLNHIFKNDNIFKKMATMNRVEKISYSAAKKLKKLSGAWTGANSSLGYASYTAYLALEIEKGILNSVDWQANNPGFQAKITDVDEKYIYIKILEADQYPADWDLKTEDKIQYELYSKYELRLKYNGTTCIFYRHNNLSDEQIDQLKQLVNVNWVAQDNSKLSLSFSYYNIALYDVSKKSEDQLVFSGITYFKTKDSMIDTIPEITIVKDTNSIWRGIGQEKIARLHYSLSQNGKILTLNYQGKKTIFKKNGINRN